MVLESKVVLLLNSKSSTGSAGSMSAKANHRKPDSDKLVTNRLVKELLLGFVMPRVVVYTCTQDI